MSWSIVQSAQGSSSGATTGAVTATLPSAVTVGNRVVIIPLALCNGSGPGLTFSAVGDNKSNSYTQLSSKNLDYNASVNWETVALYLATVTTGGTGLTATATPSASGYCSIIVAEVSCNPGTVTLAGSAGTGSSPGTALSSGNVAVAGNCLVLGVPTTLNTSGSISPGSGYTTLQSVPATSGSVIPALVEYILNTSTNPASPTATAPSSASWTMAGFALEEPAAPTYTMTGPSSGLVGVASTNFTFTPSASVTDTLTMGDGSNGGTWTPATLSWSGSSAAQTATYTPASAGAKSLTATSGAGYTVTGSPATYTVSATYTMTGPSTGPVGSPSTNFTFTPSGTVTSDTLTLGDGSNGGTWTPATLSWSGSNAAKTATYSAASAGTKSLTATSADGYAVTGSPFSYTASTNPTYTMTGPSQGGVGLASTNFTFTPSASLTDTLTLGDGSNGGTWTPATLSWSGSSAAQTATYTPASAGAKSLTATSGHSYTVNGSPFSYTALALATGYTVSGASSGTVGAASGPIYVTPNGWVASDTVTPSDGGQGGTFTPTSLSFTNTAAALSVTYAAAAAGVLGLTFTSGHGLAVTGSPWSFTASAVAAAIRFGSTIASGLIPSGQASSITVTTRSNAGTAAPSAASGTTIAGPYESATEAGRYYCTASYPASVLPLGTIPVVVWTYGGQSWDDPSPRCMSGVLDPITGALGHNMRQKIELILAAVSAQFAAATLPNSPIGVRDAGNAQTVLELGFDQYGNRTSAAYNPLP